MTRQLVRYAADGLRQVRLVYVVASAFMVVLLTALTLNEEGAVWAAGVFVVTTLAYGWLLAYAGHRAERRGQYIERERTTR